MSHVLVTGGAGFIGSHLVDRLVEGGTAVRVLDSLEPQVHGSSTGHRNPAAEYVRGSVMDRGDVAAALAGVDAVIHLAAQVGVGQSMYEISRYVEENCVGTAVLLEGIAAQGGVSTLVVASSMSIYGEGQYACDQCGESATEVTRAIEPPRSRPFVREGDPQSRRWDPTCVRCGAPARPVPTPESKPLRSDSVYATTKRDQEDLCLVFGRAYGVRTVALRFFNCYGPRQSLSNPYTGVAAIFASRLLNGRPPVVFEDGLQSRDFVHVSDIVQAIERSLAGDAADVALNVGTGVPTTVLDVARVLARALHGEPGRGSTSIEPEIAGRFRQGDIRHCYADIRRIRSVLGYEPTVQVEEGLTELVGWIRDELPDAEDLTDRSTAELSQRGLVV